MIRVGRDSLKSYGHTDGVDHLHGVHTARASARSENSAQRVGQQMNDDQAGADTGQAAQELSPVRQISVVELKHLMESEEVYELVDVRTDAERTIATIAGFRLLDRDYHDRLVECDRETPMIFQCHHGIRSQQAAEYFREQGFRELYNVQGGIDAWSQRVDPSVPRY